MTRRVDRFAVTRSRRALLTLLLSVLLVGMRQEAQLHGLLHFLPFAVSQEQASHPSPEMPPGIGPDSPGRTDCEIP